MSIVGAKAMAEIYATFGSVSTIPSRISGSGTQWIVAASEVILAYRKALTAIAIAAYRLHRALITGYTIQVPGSTSSNQRVSLNQLREEFRAALEEYDAADALKGRLPEEPLPEADEPSDEMATLDPRDNIDRWDGRGDDGDIIEELIDDLEAALAAEDERVAAEIADRLRQLGPDRLEKWIEKNIDSEEIEAQHSKSSRMTAADAGRVVKNAGRGTRYLIGELDERVKAYARVQGGESSCAFCTMLISRGPVYKTAREAGEQNQYHPGCDCDVVCVYADEWSSDPRSEQAREAMSVYRDAQSEQSGQGTKNPALTALRRYLRARSKNQ